MRLDGRERALRALNFEEVDRVPILGGFCAHPEFLSMASKGNMKPNWWLEDRGLWKRRRKMKQAVRAYRNVGADLIVQMVLPKPLGATTGGKLGRPTNFSLNAARATQSANDPGRFRTSEDVLAYVQNLPSSKDLKSSFDFDGAYRKYVREMKQGQKECGDDILWIKGYGQCRFMFFGLFGYQNYLSACIRYRKEMAKLFEYSGEEGRLWNEAIAKAVKEEGLPPFVYGGQDICYDHGPMLSPSLLDEMYFPHLKRAIEPLKNAGIKIIWHCDGNIMPILDRLIDAGMDGFQGFQEEAGVDFAKLAETKTKSGDPPILLGSISVTTTLPFGTIEDVKMDVERCINIAAPRGGLVLAPTSTVAPGVPTENIFAMYEHGKEYGREFCQNI